MSHCQDKYLEDKEHYVVMYYYDMIREYMIYDVVFLI